MRKGKILALITGFLVFFLLNPQVALAASTVMSFIPQSGSFGKPFSVDLIIDGHGDKFNAAQATITLSPNLKIQDLALGDCNFSYLKTPSSQAPSFAGVILSAGSTKCTVYTLTLVPIEKGSASISLSKASVKRYGDAKEVLSSISNAAYTLTGVSKVQSSPQANTSQNGLYTLYFKVSSPNGTVVNAAVILSSVSKKNQQQVTTDNTGIAHFSNLQAGVYDAIVKEGGNKGQYTELCGKSESGILN